MDPTTLTPTPTTLKREPAKGPIPDTFRGGQSAISFQAFPQKFSNNEVWVQTRDELFLQAVFIDRVASCYDLPQGMVRTTREETILSRDRNMIEIATLSILLITVGESTSMETSWRTLLVAKWPPGRRLRAATFGNARLPPTTGEEEQILLKQPAIMLLTEFCLSRALLTTKTGESRTRPHACQAWRRSCSLERTACAVRVTAT